MKTCTEESLIAALREIRNRGWSPNARRGNVGGIGNTLEDLLGIEENNLPMPMLLSGNSSVIGPVALPSPPLPYS